MTARLIFALVVIAGIATGLLALFWAGDHHGAKRIQAKWDAAVAAAILRGQTARSDAVRAVKGGNVPGDHFNRDKP